MTGEPEDEPASRRRLLRVAAAGAAGAGAALLAGCHHSTRPHSNVKPVGAQAAADIAILNHLLDVEHLGIAAYTAAIPLLEQPAYSAAMRFLGQELDHAAGLTGLIKEAKGEANKPAPSYRLAPARNHDEALRLLHGVETFQIASYVKALPKLVPGPFRAAAATILPVDGQHISILRGLQGLEPLPAPFANGGE